MVKRASPPRATRRKKAARGAAAKRASAAAAPEPSDAAAETDETDAESEESDEAVDVEEGGELALEEGEASPGRESRSLSEDRFGALVPTDNLQRYLAEIRRHPLLDPDEEHDLAVRWREEGDRDAGLRLVTSNLRLVVMIARQYQKAFKNLLDLVQEGNIGLLEAVKNFDPYRGVRFPSYAVWWIRAYIIRYVMNNWRMVKLGTTQAQRKLFFNLQREKDRLEREGFRPDPALIAERLSVKPSEVVEMEQRLSGRDVSVDAPVGDDGDASMLDFLTDGGGEPEDEVGDSELRGLLQDRIREFGETLDEKERVIFQERMVADEPKTLQELGDLYGVSRERIRQLEERIKRRLRAFLIEHVPDIADVEVRTPSTRN